MIAQCFLCLGQIVVDGNAIFTGSVTANEIVGNTIDVLEGTTVLINTSFRI